ncbi:MAG TPA: RNA 2',3'-cyclic phosphodiesterase [Casimicrobiaceae bacterium]|nr:RNA 2',3'-cyclic phosphodiesterase [Casimicrobiaceae bacterium]
MEDGVGEKSRRFFFALWPDPPARAAIGRLAREVALESCGRPTPPDLAHLTLAFVGPQPSLRVDSLRRLAGLVRGQSFMISLDKVGVFEKTGIAWLGASSLQQELNALQRDLADALRSRGFPVDARPYTPHLTLARRATVAVERRLPESIGWRVSGFSLVASDTTGAQPVYRTVAQWPLVSF